MNTVTTKGKPKDPRPFEQGDIFVDKDDDALYLLIAVGELWACAALHAGNTYNGFQRSVEDAITDLTFFARNAKITIEKP